MKKINPFNLLFSIFLAISIALKVVIDKDVDFFIQEFHINPLFIVTVILLSIVIYSILNNLFSLLDDIKLNKKPFVLDKKKIFFIFLGIFLVSLFGLLVFYPAVYLNDTLYMLYDPTCRGSPILYGEVMSLTFFALKKFFTPEHCVFIMSVIQTFIASVILTYVIVWFHKRYNHKILILLLILYYTFMLIVPNYNIALNKDSPFSLMILLFFLFVYEIVESKGEVLTKKKFLFKVFLVSCLAMYIRNNGFILVFLSLIVIFIYYGFKKYKKQCIVLLSSILLFSFIPVIVSNLVHADLLKREWYAIPIQQVSYLVKYHPEQFTKKDYKLLSKFAKNPRITLGWRYSPYTVDAVKFDPDFDNEKFNKYSKEFLLLWIRKFPRNISSYTKSYLLNNYDLWSMNKLDTMQSVFTGTSFIGLEKSKHIYHRDLFPRNIQDKLVQFYYKALVYLNPAECFILLMIINLYALRRKKKEIVMISSPLLLLWFTLMLGTPYSSALRYMAPYIYILPIILLCTFKITRKGDKNGLFKKSKR